MARSQYHVVPAGDQWKVEKSSQVVGTYDTRTPPSSKAVGSPKDNTPSQLVIHGGDGRIEAEHTYGDDPYPPAG